MSENEAPADEGEPTESGTEGSSDADESESAGPGAGTTSGSDENELIKEWAIFVTGLFGAVGAGIGLNLLIQNQIGRNVVSATASGGGDGGGSIQQSTLDTIATGASTGGTLQAPAMLGIAAAVALGVWVGSTLDVDDELAYKVVGASSAVGTVVLWIVSVFLLVSSGAVGVDPFINQLSAQTISLSVNFLGLVINAVAAGVVAAVAGVGGTWLVRNQAPDGFDAEAGVGSGVVGTAD